MPLRDRPSDYVAWLRVRIPGNGTRPLLGGLSSCLPAVTVLGRSIRTSSPSVPWNPWDAASAAYRLRVLARTLPFSVSDARLVPSNNNDVWRLETGYLRVAWRGTEAASPGRPGCWQEVTHPLHTLRRLIDTPLPLSDVDIP
jgi:hypothetical protein